MRMQTACFLVVMISGAMAQPTPPNQLRGRQLAPGPQTTTDNRSPGTSPGTGAAYNDGRLNGAAQVYVHHTAVRNFMDQNNNHSPPEKPLPSPPYPAGLDKNLMEEHSLKTLPPQEPPALEKHTLPCCYKMSTTVSDFVADNNNLPRKGASALHGVVTPELTAEQKAQVDKGVITSSTFLEVQKAGACRSCNEKEQAADRMMRFKDHNMFKHSKHHKH